MTNESKPEKIKRPTAGLFFEKDIYTELVIVIYDKLKAGYDFTGCRTIDCLCYNTKSLPDIVIFHPHRLNPICTRKIVPQIVKNPETIFFVLTSSLIVDAPRESLEVFDNVFPIYENELENITEVVQGIYQEFNKSYGDLMKTPSSSLHTQD
jgi:hypothetical protein